MQPNLSIKKLMIVKLTSIPGLSPKTLMEQPRKA